MSAARSVAIAGLLAFVALVPGALADCGFNHDGGNTPPSSFSTQTAPAGPSPVALASLVLVPVGLVVGLLAVARRIAPKPVSGHWVATPAQWMWVEDPK